MDSPEMDLLFVLASNLAAALAASMDDSKLQESAVKDVQAQHQANGQFLAVCAAAAAMSVQLAPALPHSLHALRGAPTMISS
eukprot:1510190-Amphidinium_carterae.2